MADHNIHPDAPRNRSPVKIMAATMALIVAISVWEMTKEERRSVKATITMPTLSAVEQRGRDDFNRLCSECHGTDATGGAKAGPPLMHPYYRVGKLTDDDFKRIISQGAPQRLWKFGYMPAQVNVTDAEAESMVTFFNALRAVNGMGD